MNLEGEIWELELIPRLVELGSQSFTGALRFEHDSVIKIVYFKEGNILSASTNDRADSIDEILLRSGKVTRDHVKQALSKRKETETLGDALLGLGFIAKRELAWARRVQLVGILRSVSEWQAGSFTIVADYLPKREEGTAFGLPQIVLELILTDQDRSKYDRLLESGSAVFRKSAAYDSTFSALGLNQEAEAISSRIDGVRSAAEVASESGSDAFNVYKLLHALNLLGLIERLEKSHEVSPDRFAAEFGSPVAPTGPTVEMSLDFGRGAGSFENGGAIGTSAPVPDYDDGSRFESDSSVPREELDSYSYEPPVAEVEEDLAIGVPSSIDRSPRAPSTPMDRGGSKGAGSVEALRNFEIPAAEFPPIEERIAQKQAKKKPLSTPAPRKSRKTGVLAAAAVAVIAIGAAGGWYYFEKLRGEEQVALTQPAPVTAKPAPPASTTATATETTASSPGTTTAPAPAVAATATDSTSVAPATTTQAPPAAVTTTRAPETKPAPPPVPPPTVVTKPPTPPPSTPSSSKYASQAQQYVREAATVPFTVQFELVCRDASIEKAINVGGSKVWFVPITYRGESCYRVFWGRYSTREQAERGAGEIPASLRGGKATVVSPGSR